MNVELGARIRNIREAKGLTQEQLALELKCSRQRYARLENGSVDISYTNLSDISSILGISISEITSAVEKNGTFFRMAGKGSIKDDFNMIKDMIDTFYAHGRLYHRVNDVDL